MTYVRSLDGVRALAVGMVMLYHFGFLECGWAGVQLFFVLSGFLITGILVGQRELPLGTYLARFYKRRALRIFPLFFLYAGVITAAHFALGRPQVTRTQFAFLYSYSFNVAQTLSITQDNRWLSHLWSLAVEEQFYFVWPFVVFWLSPGALRKLALALLVVCPLARLAFAANADALTGGLLKSDVATILYRITPFQLDAFASGALLSLSAPTEPARARRSFWVTLALVALAGALNYAGLRRIGEASLSSFGYPPDLRFLGQYVWGYTAVNLLGAALIRRCAQAGAAFAIFERPLLVHLGRISYGLYVFHIPVREVILTFLHGPVRPWQVAALFAAFAGGSYALAWASFTFFEKRFLAWKDRPLRELWTRPAPLALAGTEPPER